MKNMEISDQNKSTESTNAEAPTSGQHCGNALLPDVLYLTVKKKWYDMILSGVKLEEYREIKMYWWKRLVECGQCYKGYIDGVDDLAEVLLPVSEWEMKLSKKYDFVKFINGYAKNAPSFIIEFKGIEIGAAKPEWSDNWQGDVFKIKLGNIIHQ